MKRNRPDDLDIMKVGSTTHPSQQHHRMTSPHTIKQERMTSHHADSTDDVGSLDRSDGSGGSDPMTSPSSSCHGYRKTGDSGKLRMTSHEVSGSSGSPIPSPTQQCQYGVMGLGGQGVDASSMKLPGYGSSPAYMGGMSGGGGFGNSSVYYPHHHHSSVSAGRMPSLTGPVSASASSSSSSFLNGVSGTSSSLFSPGGMSCPPGLAFSSQMAACRLAAQSSSSSPASPPDCAFRQTPGAATALGGLNGSSSASSSSNPLGGAAPGAYSGLRPVQGGATPHHPHGSLPSCTYMQSSGPSSYTPHHLAAANMHVMNMNFPGQLA